MAISAKTVNSDVYVGSGAWLQKLTRVLEWTVSPNNTTTNEAFLGDRAEEASIHAIQHTFEFGTLYDGDETDVLRTHSADASDDNPYVMIVDNRLKSFEGGVANLLGLTDAVPETDAITDSLTMPESGAHYFGQEVTAFDLKTGALTESVPDFAATADTFLVVEAINGVAVVTIADSSETEDVAVAQVGIFKVPSVAITSGNVSIAAGSASGYFLIGAETETPSG